MNFIRLFPSIIASILIAGLAAADSESIVVEIRGGETTLVDFSGSQIQLRFVSVVSDERCPALVTCSWANPPVVTIKAEISGNEAKIFQVAAGGPTGALQGVYKGFAIRYLDLSPAPQTPSDFSKLRPLEIYTVRLSIVAPQL